MTLGFVFDLNRCTGCQACVLACWMENRQRQTQNWRQVHTFNGFHHPDQSCFQLSLACHHCEHPACLAQCPAKAYTKDAKTGAVLLHPERCLGCRYCTWACPYDAPKFSVSTGLVEKCTFCAERLAEGLEPACVARCPMGALGLDPERSQQDAARVPGFPLAELKPGIRFVPLRRELPPEVTAPANRMQGFVEHLIALPPPKITLRGEWSLVLFTTLLAILVAWQAASLLQGPALRPWLFLLLGASNLALSAWHLGHPERAWRAVLNVGTSWLSREILLFSAFLGIVGLQALWFSDTRALGLIAAITGFAALFAVDRIYRVALRMGPWNLHSAHVFLNGLYLLGWLASLWPLIILVGTLKLLLYLHRKWYRVQTPKPFLSSVRVLFGFVLPGLLPPGFSALAVVLGDLVDRCEYYAELELPSPQRQLAEELRQRLRLGLR